MFFVKKGVAARLREVGYDYDRAKVRWRQYCEVVSKVPIYFKAWYWDATCDATDDWWVVILEDSVGEIEAAFPFVYQKRKGLYFIETPWQVAAAGIWINKTDVSLGELTKYTEEVLNTLPKYDRFSMIFSSKYWTWQPFYWQGFQSAPYYTMCVKANSPEDVLPSISKDRRKRVNRGKKKYRIETDRITFQQYWEFLISSYEDRERNLQYEKKKFYKLYTALVDHNACHIRAVYDGDNIVAVNIMLVDDGKYYHQFGTQMKNADPNATSYAIYDAISGAIAEGKVFDFEGSMIQGVCEFNSSFHPVWETEYRIENYSSRYIIIDSLRRIAVVIKNSIAKQLRGGITIKRQRRSGVNSVR